MGEANMKVENTQWQEHLTEIDKYMCVGGGKNLLSGNVCLNAGDGVKLLPFEQDGYTYRFADIHDYESVKCVVDEVFQFDLLKDNFIEYYNNSNFKILIALMGEQPAGTLCMERQCDYFNNKRIIIFVRNAGIREKFRRNGVFKQLYAIAYEYAKLMNAAAIELTCANYRSAAHNFYLNNGFTKKKTTVFIREIEV